MRIFPLGCEKLELIIYAGFHGHVAGCYENEEGQVVFDLTVADGNVFFFFPPDGQDASTLNARNRLQSITHRWVFDPKGKTGSHVKPESAGTPVVNSPVLMIDSLPKSTIIFGRPGLIQPGNMTRLNVARQLEASSIAWATTRGMRRVKMYSGPGHERHFRNQHLFLKMAAERAKDGSSPLLTA